MFSGGPRKPSCFRRTVSPPNQCTVLMRKKSITPWMLSLNYVFQAPDLGSSNRPLLALGKDAAAAIEQPGVGKASDGRFLWCLHTAGLLASKCSSALKALTAPAGGSQFVCFPAQVPSVCRIACAVDERDGDGEGKGPLGWER